MQECSLSSSGSYVQEHVKLQSFLGERSPPPGVRPGQAVSSDGIDTFGLSSLGTSPSWNAEQTAADESSPMLGIPFAVFLESRGVEGWYSDRTEPVTNATRGPVLFPSKRGKSRPTTPAP